MYNNVLDRHEVFRDFYVGNISDVWSGFSANDVLNIPYP